MSLCFCLIHSQEKKLVVFLAILKIWWVLSGLYTQKSYVLDLESKGKTYGLIRLSYSLHVFLDRFSLLFHPINRLSLSDQNPSDFQAKYTSALIASSPFKKYFYFLLILLQLQNCALQTLFKQKLGVIEVILCFF